MNYDIKKNKVINVMREISKEFPDFQLKESRFVPLLALTIGQTIFIRKGKWDTLSESDRILLICHEVVHMRQQKRWTIPLFVFLYLFCLPMGLSYWRYIWEAEAYAENIRIYRSFFGINAAIISIDCYTNMLSGRWYLWPWPRSRIKNRLRELSAAYLVK
jgi:hypothetical protein